MNCFICKSSVSTHDPIGDHVCMDCPECGEYKISGTAIKFLESKPTDPDLIREILDAKRDLGKIVPMLTAMDI